MITFMDSKEKLKETEKYLDSQLWHACAGSMVQMPAPNSKVFYFPQGHAEHASGEVEFRNCTRVPAYIACKACSIKFMADPETDEVYAKIRLVPVAGNTVNFDDEEIDGTNGSDSQDKPTSFAKTLTQSDANNGGGFSVPRYCAETIFPRLDYSADPPVQTILAKDVHGDTWKFRHIYRGTPRRHLLTTGWSTFVNHKKLVAGDSIVFLRAENGDLCVGIRRAKRGIGGSTDSNPSGWNPAGGNYGMPYGGFSAFLREDEGKMLRNGGSPSGSGNSSCKGRVRAESVIEAATLAANGQPFEVVYYPRASTPEFCVKAALVKAALQVRWCSGMRFKMPFETEDSSRISWFMGTISAVQVADPIQWPDSPWRLLQVTWDEPDLLQNVKRVSPWLVELVSNMPPIHLSPFSPPRKKLRPPHQPDWDLQIPMPSTQFSSNFLGPHNPFSYNNNNPAGMQGARHAQYGISLSDLHLSKQLQPGGFYPPPPCGFSPLDHAAIIRPPTINPILNNHSSSDNVSCLLTIGNSNSNTSNKSDNRKPSQFLLFGQPISLSSSSEGDNNKKRSINCRDNNGETLETGHCKVFMESEDVGRTLDLSLLGSYEELYKKLANMFGLESSEMLNHVIYRDVTGAVKQIGKEPFSDFMKIARRLTILTGSSSDNVGM